MNETHSFNQICPTVHLVSFLCGQSWGVRRHRAGQWLARRRRGRPEKEKEKEKEKEEKAHGAPQE